MFKLDISRVWAQAALASLCLTLMGCAQARDARVAKALQIKAKTLRVRDGMTEGEVVRIMGPPAGMYDYDSNSPNCSEFGPLVSRELVFDVPRSHNAQFAVGLGIIAPLPQLYVRRIGFRVDMVANGAPPAEIIEPERFWKWLEHGPADEWLEVDWLTK